MARLSVSDTVCMTDLSPSSARSHGVNSHRLSAVTEMLGKNLEQIIPELVFNLMHLLLEAARIPRKGANVQAAFYLPTSFGFKLFDFEIPGSKRQFYFYNLGQNLPLFARGQN